MEGTCCKCSYFLLTIVTWAVPRNFRLLEELEKGEKADAAAYSYGLSDRDDLYMYNWDATITVPPAGVRELFIFADCETCVCGFCQLCGSI